MGDGVSHAAVGHSYFFLNTMELRTAAEEEMLFGGTIMLKL